MTDFYQETLLDLAKHPSHHGKLESADVVADGFLASCGDQVRWYLKLSDDKTTIVDVAWEGEGCVISQASCSVVSDWLIGKKVDELDQLTFEMIVQKLGFESMSPGRVKCVLLGLNTVQKKVLVPVTAETAQ